MENRIRQAVAVAMVVFVSPVAAAQVIGTPPVAVARATPHDTSGRRSNGTSAIEISGFLVGLSVVDRVLYPNLYQDGKKVYSSTFASTWEHLRQQRWVHDQDPFNVNQFQHPYQGATMYGFARSSGHGFLTSLLQADIGSFAWKMAGETDPPSINDMITTGQAGALLGEVMYRMADLILKDVPSDKPHRWHDYLADFISPPGALNRRMFGERFHADLPDSAPATSWQVRLGVSGDALAHDYSAPTTLLRRDATAEFWLSYGLPGQPGYEYTRPLDYFDFEMAMRSSGGNPIEDMMIRGLLFGGKTDPTEHSRGIWGLYGSYDYISPYLFRVSSTAVSLGTTRQTWLSPSLALQGSLLGGVGYGAAGSTTVTPSTPTNAEIRDYHFGVTPQALGALRFILGDRAMIDMAGREYYVSGLGSDDKHGSETIFRGNLGFNVRMVGGHTLGMRIVSSNRLAKYGTLLDKRSSEATVTFAYSFLGGNHFSAVKWDR